MTILCKNNDKIVKIRPAMGIRALLKNYAARFCSELKQGFVPNLHKTQQSVDLGLKIELQDLHR